MSTPRSLSNSYYFVSSVSVLIFGFHYSACLAQQTSAANDVVEEVVVTGIRSSLENAMDIKRDSQGVVDAISAEDIGKFPDANLAESLQRITGVSIDRQNNEGNQITVRGLGPSFNMVTLNGRQMPVASSPEQESIASATQSRAFNFAEIASESVSAVEVYKTGRANLTTGGMGATVNIKTARPLETGNKLVVNTKAIHDSSVEVGDDITPEAGILFSSSSEDGKAGILVNASYSDRQFSEVSTHTDGWLRDQRDEVQADGSTTPGTGYPVWCSDPSSQCGNAPYVYRPVSNISEIKNFERRRTNAQFVVQYSPIEEMVATIDYTLSRFRRSEDRFGTGRFGTVNINDGDIARNTRLTPSLTLDSVDRLSNETGTNNASDSLVYNNQLKVKNDSYGFNLDWQVSDELTVTFDAHSSSATSQPDGELNDNLALLQGPTGVNYSFDYSGSGVDIVVDDSGARRGNGQFSSDTITDEDGEQVVVGDREGVDGFQDPDGFSPLGTFIRNISIENDVDQYQVQFDWSSDVINVFGGVSYVEYEVKTNAISTGFQFQNLDGCPGCENLISLESIDAPSGFNVVNVFDVNSVVEQSFPNQPSDILANTPPTFFGVTEESTAVFFGGSMDLELAGLESKIYAGFRYESTDVSGSAFQTFPIGLQITASTEGEVLFDTDAAPELFQVDESYDFFLPSVDFQVNLTEEMVGRASYSRSIARPDLNALRPLLTVSDYRPGNSTASQGNPGLQPYISDNFDLSYEWYYADGSYLSSAFFYKRVDDYIATETVSSTFPDANGQPLLDPQNRFVGAEDGQAADPVTSQEGDPEAIFDTTIPLNTESREITGLELAVQHLFGDSGLGVQANYTIVDSDAEFEPTNAANQTVLVGLSDSANLVGFFENDLFSARLALNWREEFLFALGQLRAADEPTFVKEYYQLDFSSSFNVSENLTAVFEVLNITGEDQRQRGRFAEQFLFENDQKPRFALGLRGNF